MLHTFSPIEFPMIRDNSYAFIYEDDDDCIHAQRGVKREHTSELITPLSTYNYTHKLYNHNDQLDNVGSKRRRINNTADSGLCSSLKKSKTGRRIPEIVIKQAHLEKSQLKDIFETFVGLEYIPPKCGNKTMLDKESADFFENRISVLLFLFDCSNFSYLKFFELFPQKNIKVIGITPEFGLYNDQSYPIVLDKNGDIAKQLSIRNPLGGGIYPIPSIILFDSSQTEIFRIKLGYDYNVYYDSSVENNLQSVLIEGVNYAVST